MRFDGDAMYMGCGKGGDGKRMGCEDGLRTGLGWAVRMGHGDGLRTG